MNTTANEIIDKVSAQRDEVMEICAQTQAMLGKALDQRDDLRAALDVAETVLRDRQFISNGECGDNDDEVQSALLIVRAALAKVPK